MCNNFSFFFRPPPAQGWAGHFAPHELDLINSNVCLPCPKGFQPETATQTHTALPFLRPGTTMPGPCHLEPGLAPQQIYFYCKLQFCILGYQLSVRPHNINVYIMND